VGAPGETAVEDVAADREETQAGIEPVGDGRQVGADEADGVRHTERAAAFEQAQVGHRRRPARERPSPSAGSRYTVAFSWSAGIFAVCGILVAALLRSGVAQLDAGSDAVIAI